MGLIQLRRILNGFDKGFTYDEIISKLTERIANYSDGEPIICDYSYNGNRKFLLAIKTDGNISAFPMFESLADIQEFIKTNSSTIGIIDIISEDSEISAESDADGKLVLKLKDEFKTIWEELI